MVYDIESIPINVMQSNQKTSVDLDASGQFLNIKPSLPQMTPEEKVKADRQLLMDQLHFLFRHRKTIMADPRMYLAPVAVGHNLAYSGTSGFRNPTLGVIMKWLEVSPYAKDIDENGEVAFLGWMAGSPLSGCNKCTFVSKDGHQYTKTIRRPHAFFHTWRGFVRINSRFAKIREESEVTPYLLEEVLVLLKED